MTDEIEEALRRELQAQWVPFDEARAEDMVRAAAESGLAGAPRAWVAPLAAAAAVVVVGGGVALATSGGGGNSSSAQPGGPGVGPSTGSNNYVVGPCSPVGSGGGVIGTAYPVSEAPTGSNAGSVMPGTYTAVNEGTSAPDLPPPPESATATPVRVPPTAAGSPTEIPASAPAPTASDLPTSVGSDGTIYIARSDSIVICEVGTAGATLGSDGCTTRRTAVICVSSGDCSTAKDASSSPDNTVVCVGEGSIEPLPTEAPTEAGSVPPGSAAECPPGALCRSGAPSDLPTETPSSSGSADGPVSFTVQTDVLPGERGGKAYVPDIPQGYRLEVTGLTLRNPAADQGTLTLGEGNTDLLHENLADFRVQDDHFTDQPIVFTAGTPFVLGVNCANSNDNCTPSVDVTGRLVPAN
jgi:hypothetical protein